VANRNWQLHPVIATAIGINVAILALAVARSGGDPAPLWHLLGEDGIVEWMQFLCFSVMALLLGFVAVDRANRGTGLSLEVIGIAGLSVLVALAALEEISWFQRVLNVESPEFFREHNRQRETNLHNLALGSGSVHKTVLVKLIFLIGIMHNLVLPLLARSKPAIRRWVEALGLYLPPLSAAVPYLLLVLLSHILIDHPRKGELGEMFGAVHYLSTVFVAYLVGVGYGRPAVIESRADSTRVSVLFAMFMTFLLFVSWLLAETSSRLAAS